MDPRLPRGEHCKACKLRWWRLPPSPYFPLDTPMPVSAGGCRYHIILPALQSGGLGQSYHIRVTSERSIPIRAQPRNWRPLSTAILGQRGTAECSHCSLQAIQLSLCTEMHPFTEKEAIIAVKKTLNADMSQNRAKSAQLVFALPLAGVGQCWSAAAGCSFAI